MTNATPNVIGKTFEEAIKILNESGYTFRVLEIDGVSRIGTCDYVLTRVGLSLKDNVVTDQSNG